MWGIRSPLGLCCTHVVKIQHHGNKMFANDKEVPKPTYWDEPKKFKWLQDHPTTCPKEVEFIHKEIACIRNCLLIKSINEKQNNKKKSKQNCIGGLMGHVFSG